MKPTQKCHGNRESTHKHNPTREEKTIHTQTHIIRTLWKRQNQKYINYPAGCVCLCVCFVIQLITECRIQQRVVFQFFVPPLGALSLKQQQQKMHVETVECFCFFSSLQFRIYRCVFLFMAVARFLHSIVCAFGFVHHFSHLRCRVSTIIRQPAS